MTDIEIVRASPGDAGEILTLQRAAYVTEAQMYGDPFIAPLVESYEQVLAAIATGVVLKAVEGARVVGSVRGRLPDPARHEGGPPVRPGRETTSSTGPACVVGRLVVAPDRQGNGIGTALLDALHAEIPEAAAFDLFTGHLSEGNLRLYRRLGYRETRRERLQDHLTLIHMRREAAPR
ncbi:GNAT family N-acetyltransferase [Microtetraspora niveoalba]|uniref:GNAT family N-acetyltransferase n=1 Tax=Microtetraspora niveoalba TaxID=46175 RepID=UPI000836EEE6|nr:GNAT family N-acetyltransferase [Microtetraspora niveoalba]